MDFSFQLYLAKHLFCFDVSLKWSRKKLFFESEKKCIVCFVLSTDCGFSPHAEIVFTGTSYIEEYNVDGCLLFFDSSNFELVYRIEFPKTVSVFASFLLFFIFCFNPLIVVILLFIIVIDYYCYCYIYFTFIIITYYYSLLTIFIYFLYLEKNFEKFKILLIIDVFLNPKTIANCTHVL